MPCLSPACDAGRYELEPVRRWEGGGARTPRLQGGMESPLDSGDPLSVNFLGAVAARWSGFCSARAFRLFSETGTWRIGAPLKWVRGPS